MIFKVCNKCYKNKKIFYFRFRLDSNKYRNQCKECESKQKKYIYYNNHKKYLKQKQKYRNNPEIKKRRRAQEKNRRQLDVEYRIKVNLRNRLYKSIKNNYKSGSAIRDLGCSIGCFKLYIENKFYPNPINGQNMSWDNWGINGWHIDHIIPLSYFDLTDNKQLLKACHYTNLQPLWAKENIEKGASHKWLAVD